MSVFHRVDDLDQIPARLFLPRMVRLLAYDGAVRLALLSSERSEPVPQQSAPRPAPPAAAVLETQPTPHTLDQLAALNKTREYGPLGLSQQVGIFDVG